MIRINEVKLPLDHSEVALHDFVINKLSINKDQLVDIHVFKRGYDARKKNDIYLIYTLDITLKDVDEEQLLFLRSRGITQERAKELLVKGFLAEQMGGLVLPEKYNFII